MEFIELMEQVSEKRQKTIRIILGPTPWSIDDIHNDEDAIDIKFLKKTRVKNKEDKKYIYYDEKTVVRYSGFFPDDFFNRLLDDCVKDPMCYYLAEREGGNLFEGSFLTSIRIAEYVSYVLYIYNTHNPDIIVFHNYPHELFTYILLKSTIYSDARPLVVHFSVLPWRMRISYLTKNLSLMSIKNPEGYSDESACHVLKYFNKLRGTHEEAMPAVDKELKKNANNNFLSLKKEFLGIVKSNPIKNLMRIFLKRYSFVALKNSISEKPGGPYVVFFLHYQPEESTLPRGGIFSQQFNAIIKLRSTIPKSINLLVKEHPSMYRYEHTLSIPVRSKSFYQNIRRLFGVYIISQEMDTFRLIDNALAVSTITGTVAVEALARGKPVICFGEPYYKNYVGVICYQDMNGTGLDFMEIQKHDPMKTQTDLINELSYSFGGDPTHYSSDLDAQHGAALAAFKFIFSRIDEITCIINKDISNKQ